MKLWHVIVFVIALVISGVILAPAAILVRQQPGLLEFERAQGGIWNGQLEGVRVGPYQAERARWRVGFGDLLQGEVHAPIVFDSGTIEGQITLSADIRNGRRISIQSLRVEGVQMGSRTWPGEVQVRHLDIVFTDGVCTSARGAVSSDVWLRARANDARAGPPLSGEAACEGEDAVITMSGQSALGEQGIGRMVLRGDGTGAYRMAIQDARPETTAELEAAGFHLAGGEVGFGEEIRWLP
jgi:hypothetical protein